MKAGPEDERGPLTRTPVKKVNCLEGSVHDPKAKTASPQRHLVDHDPCGHHLLELDANGVVPPRRGVLLEYQMG